MHVLRALLLVAIPAVSLASEATILHVVPGEAGGLQRALLELARQQLQDTGLVPDREHAWLHLSAALPAGAIEARPTWSLDSSGIPALPLTFELRTVTSELTESPVRATLAVRLQRTVWIAQRRLRKGSQVGCDDFATGLREVNGARPGWSAADCAIEPGAAALRDIAAGEVLRVNDVGRAPDVQVGAPVQLSAAHGGVSVMTTAIALADARVGDQIEVRLQHPARTLRTRVIARGAVRLVDEAP
jgi:flagella basal body P-ring formation protein FlgA